VQPAPPIDLQCAASLAWLGCSLYHRLRAQVNADLTKEFTYVEVSGEYNEPLGKLCAATATASFLAVHCV
jgi:hypothetical protein